MEPRLGDVDHNAGHELERIEALLHLLRLVMTDLVPVANLIGPLVEPQPLEAYGRPQSSTLRLSLRLRPEGQVTGQPFERADVVGCDGGVVMGRKARVVPPAEQERRALLRQQASL